MRYTVLWLPSALRKLAELWNEGPDRGAIARASDEIDRRLLHDPHLQGESRDEGVRILVEDPLAVYFTVDHQDMKATVFAIWRISA